MKKITYLFVLFVFIISSCDKSLKFKTTDSGIEYAFVVQNKDGAKAKVGDAMKLNLKYYAGDSLLFSSSEVPQDFKIQYKESTYKGSVDEIFGMMTKGDSGIFKIDAENFFKNTVGVDLPPFMKKGDKLKFEIKVIDIVDAATIEAELIEKQKQQSEEEVKLLQDYLTNNNITEKPTESGLYYIVKEKGNGKQPVKGNKVSVSYTGTFMNGEVFDSSEKSGKPFEFTLGNGEVIAGWDEGVALMKVGEKATLLIPSKIAYGPEGYPGAIPPFSTLIFEITLLEIK